MKTISVKQSRRNTAGRRRKVAARHGLAGHWRAQSKPMFGTGRVHYEVGTHTDAMCYGGINEAGPRQDDRRDAETVESASAVS